MARRLSSLIPILSLFMLAPWAAAQPERAPAPAQPASAEQITLGQSAVPLYGPWKFHIGDSQIDPKTGQPLWAEPDFDDSNWEIVDLTPREGANDPISGMSGYVPGWTAKGHRDQWGYAWYRIRVHLTAPLGTKLALAGPADVDDAYQVFDSGRQVGNFGQFAGHRPKIYFTQPMMFQLAPSGGAADPASMRVIAFRVWMEPETLVQADDVGGIHSAPLVGESETVSAYYQMRREELYRAYAGSLMQGLVFGLLGVVALSLIFFDRSDKVYLLVGSLLLMIGILRCTGVIAAWSQNISGNGENLLRHVIVEPITFAGWVMVWCFWFRLRRAVWMPWGVIALAALLMVSNSLAQDLYFTVVSQPVTHAFEWVSLFLRVVLALLMLLTVFQGIREQGLGGWVVLPAVLLACFSEFYTELQFFHIVNFWFPFGIQITVQQAAQFLLVVVLAGLLLHRLVLSLRRQRQMALDVRQAQEVQQVILPEQRVVFHGFEVESEYRPAREVGGDFFQVIPNEKDGSLLIVAGDVTGKGLKAGMLVALLVGAIRSTADWSADPVIILKALNQRLMGRGDAQATCLALRIDVDGSATLANAGHMPPYLNGKPIEVEGSLPLGMIDTPEFSILRFKLAQGDRLMLLSDGIAEATNADGQLFGFERVQELIAAASSAAHVATAAQSFGQEDDISVISVTRTAMLQPA